MKIKDLVLNHSYRLSLVVISAASRTTKATSYKQGKQYLTLTFSDGIDTIPANYWDWRGENIPEANAVLLVDCQVTEWQGKKQLTVNSLRYDPSHDISDFENDSGIDIEETYKQSEELLTTIEDPFFRKLSLSMLVNLRELWLTVPAAITVHHDYKAGTLIHSHSVAVLSNALAKTIQSADVSLATAGGFLHDVGKLQSYRRVGLVNEMTGVGRMMDHSFIGAEFVGNFADHIFPNMDRECEAKVNLLRHIILSHHKSLEHGAVVTPQCVEAYIVHHADALDSSIEQICRASAKVPGDAWTSKIWALDNRQHITTQYVQNLMSGDLQSSQEENSKN